MFCPIFVLFRFYTDTYILFGTSKKEQVMTAKKKVLKKTKKKVVKKKKAVWEGPGGGRKHAHKK